MNIVLLNFLGLPLAMQASIIQCLSQAMINWEDCSRNGIQHKNQGMMEVGAPIVQMGVASRWIFGVSACYLSLHHKVVSNNGGIKDAASSL